MDGINRDDFGRAVIPLTLRHASRHPFYQSHWRGVEADLRECSDPDALDRLPPVTRDDLARMAPWVDSDDDVVAISHSTGESGTPVLRYRTRREVAAIQQVLGNAEVGRGPRVVLSLTNVGHGSSIALPGDSITLHGSVFSRTHLEQAVHLLGCRFAAPVEPDRVGGLIGPVADVSFLTSHLRSLGWETRPMEFVGVFGGYLSQANRRDLEDFWCTAPSNRFSWGEIFAGATIDAEESLDFDVHAVARCVDLDDPCRASSGVGLLAVTELWPFGWAQPLVNYLTGDVVRAEDGGLRHLGSRRSCAIVRIEGLSELLVSGVDLYEALDVADVRHESRPRPFAPACVERGRPVGGMRTFDERGRTVVEVTFAPAANGTDAAERRIRERLLQWNPATRALCEAGRVELRVRAESGTVATSLLK